MLRGKLARLEDGKDGERILGWVHEFYGLIYSRWKAWKVSAFEKVRVEFVVFIYARENYETWMPSKWDYVYSLGNL